MQVIFACFVDFVRFSFDFISILFWLQNAWLFVLALCQPVNRCCFYFISFVLKLKKIFKIVFLYYDDSYNFRFVCF